MDVRRERTEWYEDCEYFAEIFNEKSPCDASSKRKRPGNAQWSKNLDRRDSSPVWARSGRIINKNSKEKFTHSRELLRWWAFYTYRACFRQLAERCWRFGKSLMFSRVLMTKTLAQKFPQPTAYNFLYIFFLLNFTALLYGNFHERKVKLMPVTEQRCWKGCGIHPAGKILQSLIAWSFYSVAHTKYPKKRKPLIQ